MLKYLKLCSFLLSACLMFGCASHNNSSVAAINAPQGNHFQAVVKNVPIKNSTPGHDSSTGQKLVNKARTAIGTPYVLGGTQPGGFDCSGLVKWAYNSIGVELPRTAKEQSAVGQKIKKVEDMRAGDIVAFKHPKRGYHTGIYMGDGKFIHSPRQRTSVRINSLDDPYFSSTLLGARRVAITETSNMVAEAESRLSQYISQRSKLRISTNNLQSSTETKPVENNLKSVNRNSEKSSLPLTRHTGNVKNNVRKAKPSTVSTLHEVKVPSLSRQSS